MRLSDIQESLSNDAVRQLADSSIFLGLQGSIDASAISVDEGASLNFTVATGNDATYYYWVEGVSGTVDSADFSSGWADSASRGTFSVTNGIGTFSLTLASDDTTEGTETFRVKVSKASSGAEFLQSATVTINDTSLDPHTIQGSNFGYASGGLVASLTNVIEKFPFSSDANASDVGDLTVARYAPAGQSSSTHGYSSGGAGNDGGLIIDKFPFAVDTNASDAGDLTEARSSPAGQSSSTHGYTSGGLPASNVIDKFSFASDANAFDVGDLFEARYGPAGQSSSTHGYSSGGANPALPAGPILNTIDKFPFASDASASDVGDLKEARYGLSGQSSSENGYSSGGWTAPPFPVYSNQIDKFPFASDNNATDVGDLTTLRNLIHGGQSSTTHGYSAGGQNDPGSISKDIIDKFPFASNANAVDIGNLTEQKTYVAGQQY